MSSIHKSVEKALTLLEVFSEGDESVSLRSLSRQLDVSESYLYRLLQTLKGKGYLEQVSQNGTYQLGVSAYQMGQNILSKNDLLNIVRPHMSEVVNEHNEMICLALNRGNHVMFFSHVDGRNVIKVMPLDGRQYQLTECAAGEVILAYSEQKGTPYHHRLDAYSGRLELIRQQGYCVDRDSIDTGVVSVAVPLTGSTQAALAALCFVGPELRMTQAKIKEHLLPSLFRIQHTISKKLGPREVFQSRDKM